MFKILVIVFLIYGGCRVIFFSYQSKYDRSVSKIRGLLYQYKIDGNLLTLYLKGEEKIIVYYYFDSEEEKNYYEENVILGNVYEVVGEILEFTHPTIPNNFDYKRYLYFQNICYGFQASEIRKVRGNSSLFYLIKNYFLKRIDKIDNTGYLRTFILGDKSIMSSDTYSMFQKNGISHLFSISGMHVSFLVGILFWLLEKVTYKVKLKYGVGSCFLIFYYFLVGGTASIFRTSIMYILLAINKSFDLKIKSFDLILFTLCIAILIRPGILFDIGFQFSYVISFSLILFHDRIRTIKGKFWNRLYLSFLCFMVSFPICVYYFSVVNFLSILVNIIMIPFVSLILFPLSFISFLIPFVYPIFRLIVYAVEFINDFIYQISMFRFVFSKPNFWGIVIYYVVIVFSVYRIRYIGLFFLVLMIHKMFIYVDGRLIVTYLDVGQGDSIFVKLPYNRGNILIDTGGKVNRQYEDWERRRNSNFISDKIVNYFHSIGVLNLDYLILTHGDFDHMGEAIHLVENFKVDKVIFNNDYYNELETKLIKVLAKRNITYYREIKELIMDKYKLQFLNTKNYDNENDNSNVIYFNYNNYKFLFMGDAGVEKERDILEKYNLEDIEFLKVGHHGSNTSSDKEFIDSIHPKYSFISVGKNNRYGHPKDEVLDILSNSKIYRTDLDGSIEVWIGKHGYWIRTCSP